MRLKRTFKCRDCGVEFEMEADAFIPGVYGVMYNNDGKPFYFIDPTTEHRCPECNDIFVENLLGIVGVNTDD